MKRWIFVTHQVAGLHHYPAAPGEVAYLRDLHRHVFHVKVSIEVQHNERDLEFIMVKRAVQNHFTIYNRFVGGVIDFGQSSCETIAQKLLSDLCARYGPERSKRVEVSEDGENGAVLEA